MVDQVEVEKVAKAVTIAWALWHNINEIKEGGVRKDGNKLVRWATLYLEQYEAATMESCIPIPSGDERIIWRPPSPNKFKINVDGAIFVARKAVGVGVIIKDDKGRIEGAMSKKIHAPLGAMEAEAKAFEVGIQFAKDIGIQNVILEGDSLLVYKALCELSSPPSSVASIIAGIQDFCNHFHSVEFSH